MRWMRKRCFEDCFLFRCVLFFLVFHFFRFPPKLKKKKKKNPEISHDQKDPTCNRQLAAAQISVKYALYLFQSSFPDLPSSFFYPKILLLANLRETKKGGCYQDVLLGFSSSCTSNLFCTTIQHLLLHSEATSLFYFFSYSQCYHLI